MYSNTGEKILGLAQIMLVIGIVLSLVFGFLIGILVTSITYDEEASTAAFFIGLIVAAIGCVTSYLSYLLLAGFGELIENTSETHRSIELLKKEYIKFENNKVARTVSENEEPKQEAVPEDPGYANKLGFLLQKFYEGEITECELNERTAKLNEIYGGKK